MSRRKSLTIVMTQHVEHAEPPITHDRLGRPLIGPCHLWTRALDSKGYGVVGNAEFGTTSIQRTHRVAYAIAHGIPVTQMAQIPELDHLCRVTHCCAPAHLEPVTHAENVARGDWVSPHTGKPACVNEHLFDEANTRIRKSNGARECRACQREANRRNYDPAKAAARHQARKQARAGR
jgi:hypothetical protein